TKNKIFKYNFNCVDMQKYYEQRNLNDFFATNDPYHQLHSIMQKIGKNIIKNLNNFKNNSLQNNYELPKFLVKSPPEIFNLEKEFEIKELKNSLFNKKIYKLDNTIKLKFKTHFKGYTIVAIAMCHNFEKLDPFIFTSFILKNKKTKIVKRMRSSHYIVHSLNNEFIIDDESFMYFNLYNENSTEGSVWIPANNTYKNNISHCGLSSFLLAKFDKNRMINIDFEALINEDIEISKVYDFNHLIPS
ncbi:glycosyl transferase, partial [Campylobacter coli]|nr:glycosyl transferase [Campylobacter coli]